VTAERCEVTRGAARITARVQGAGPPAVLVPSLGRAGSDFGDLATRFTEVVGVPPGTYLTDWRMTVAAELLADPDLTVAAVARRVGYADAFGFSEAFKRRTGQSPSHLRRTLHPADASP